MTVRTTQTEGAGRPTKAEIERAREVLDLWWIGKGGSLKSVTDGGNAGGGSAGCDYPTIVFLHVEKFFEGDRRKWRTVADFACKNGGHMELYPEWETTPPKLFALGAGTQIGKPPALRAKGLYDGLLRGLARWLEKHPAPRMPKEFVEK